MSHFNKLFREKYGVSPMRYLIQCRMAVAKDLLVRSPLSLWEIAEKTGYESIHSFSKAFKKLECVSPGGYRVYHRHKTAADRSYPVNQ
jgi:transcriptional regulator GlxA family with amidase domain